MRNTPCAVQNHSSSFVSRLETWFLRLYCQWEFSQFRRLRTPSFPPNVVAAFSVLGCNPFWLYVSFPVMIHTPEILPWCWCKERCKWSTTIRWKTFMWVSIFELRIFCTKSLGNHQQFFSTWKSGGTEKRWLPLLKLSFSMTPLQH